MVSGLRRDNREKKDGSKETSQEAIAVIQVTDDGFWISIVELDVKSKTIKVLREHIEKKLHCTGIGKAFLEDKRINSKFKKYDKFYFIKI